MNQLTKLPSLTPLLDLEDGWMGSLQQLQMKLTNRLALLLLSLTRVRHHRVLLKLLGIVASSCLGQMQTQLQSLPLKYVHVFFWCIHMFIGQIMTFLDFGSWVDANVIFYRRQRKLKVRNHLWNLKNQSSKHSPERSIPWKADEDTGISLKSNPLTPHSSPLPLWGLLVSVKWRTSI